jgi:hypothetical protein
MNSKLVIFLCALFIIALFAETEALPLHEKYLFKRDAKAEAFTKLIYDEAEFLKRDAKAAHLKKKLFFKRDLKRFIEEEKRDAKEASPEGLFFKRALTMN